MDVGSEIDEVNFIPCNKHFNHNFIVYCLSILVIMYSFYSGFFGWMQVIGLTPLFFYSIIKFISNKKKYREVYASHIIIDQNGLNLANPSINTNFFQKGEIEFLRLGYAASFNHKKQNSNTYNPGLGLHKMYYLNLIVKLKQNKKMIIKRVLFSTESKEIDGIKKNLSQKIQDLGYPEPPKLSFLQKYVVFFLLGFLGIMLVIGI